MSVYVTPFVGVWIETIDATNDASRWTVTPFVGVWIETFWAMPKEVGHGGHTLRGCVD